MKKGELSINATVQRLAKELAVNDTSQEQCDVYHTHIIESSIPFKCGENGLTSRRSTPYLDTEMLQLFLDDFARSEAKAKLIGDCGGLGGSACVKGSAKRLSSAST